jgi:hypothetical protein
MYWLAALPKRSSPRRSRRELPNVSYLFYLMICPCASRRGRADSILTSYRTDITSALHSNLVELFLTLNIQHLSNNSQVTRLPKFSFLY